MSLLKRMLLILLTFSYGSLAYSKPLVVDKKRTIVIQGEVGSNLLAAANVIERETRTNHNPVYLVINSPGGSIIPGMIFMQAMDIAKSRGVKFICVAPVLAASMAFSIYANCDERYAFEYSLLLFHPAKTGGAFRVRELPAVYVDIKNMEDELVRRLLLVLGMDEKLFWMHFHAETLHRARDLKKITTNFLTIIDDIKGLDEVDWLDVGM